MTLLKTIPMYPTVTGFWNNCTTTTIDKINKIFGTEVASIKYKVDYIKRYIILDMCSKRIKEATMSDELNMNIIYKIIRLDSSRTSTKLDQWSRDFQLVLALLPLYQELDLESKRLN